MLTEEAIRQALHASRVVPLAVANPHSPLGLEQLAAADSPPELDFSWVQGLRAFSARPPSRRSR